VLTHILQQYYGFDVVVAEGDPFSGKKHAVEGNGWLSQALSFLRRRLPVLESTFRMVARKVNDPQQQERRQPAAA
jgi:hypothetical protein